VKATNRMTSTTRITFVVVAALVVACTSNQTQVRSTGDALHSTEVTLHSLQVPDAAETVQLLIEVEVRGGSLSWLLMDPSGEVREEGSAAEGQRPGRELRFDPLIGEWQLRLSFVDMSGSYDFRLRARW
jgi:hypothetical protein